MIFINIIYLLFALTLPINGKQNIITNLINQLYTIALDICLPSNIYDKKSQVVGPRVRP